MALAATAFSPRFAGGIGEFLTCLIRHSIGGHAVNPTMRRAGECYEVLRAIVLLVAVDVVNVLRRFKLAVVRLFPDKAVLQHVAILGRIRMIGPKEIDVAVLDSTFWLRPLPPMATMTRDEAMREAFVSPAHLGSFFDDAGRTTTPTFTETGGHGRGTREHPAPASFECTFSGFGCPELMAWKEALLSPLTGDAYERLTAGAFTDGHGSSIAERSHQ